MVTSFNWIKDLVPGLAVTPEEFRDAMTLSGSKVETITTLSADLAKIVVGQIKTIEKHPDADKLVICQVDIGTDTIQIVTGAPNVKEGQKVPVVLDGGRVAGGHDGTKTPGGIKIKKGKLRGVESNGMLCSIEELGSDRNLFPDAPEEGIYIFPEDTEVGADAVAVLGLDDTIVEYEITSNRVDCFSVLGLAREAAATFQKEFCPPETKETGVEGDVNDYISVEVQEPSLCPRYTARVVKDVKLAPSPAWMQKRLRSHGIRPINNLVDITNYVMEEYGQPMHAFDLDTIAGKKIIVKRAVDGQTFKTLDGQERTLDSSVLTINDGEKAVALAGIMGGENSMITDQVKTMLFESACFDGTNIRLSSKKIGLRTDSSSKFEKGLDPDNALAAINRACQLVEELGCGTVVRGTVDVYAKGLEEHHIPFDADWINAFLGTEIPKETMLSYLARLDLKYDDAKQEVVCPTWRQDLLAPADIAEEVARFYGYDKIPVTLPKGEATMGGISPKRKLERTARRVAEYYGFSQIMTYSFESPKVFDKLMIPPLSSEGEKDTKDRLAVPIMNPLGEDFSIMRTISLNGMLVSLATNAARRNKNVRLYELGNIYLPKALPMTDELPEERMQFTLGMYGEGDFFTMKGVVEEFLEKAEISGELTFTPEMTDRERPYLHPGRKADILCKKQRIGFIGELHPVVAETYEIKERVVLAVLDLPAVLSLQDKEGRKYRKLSNFPPVTRDISLVAPKSILVGDIERAIKEKAGEHFESVVLFDLYEGDQIEENHKSVAFSITFRGKDKTLSDEEITEAMERVMKKLKEMGLELRS